MVQTRFTSDRLIEVAETSLQQTATEESSQPDKIKEFRALLKKYSMGASLFEQSLVILSQAALGELESFLLEVKNESSDVKNTIAAELAPFISEQKKYS